MEKPLSETQTYQAKFKAARARARQATACLRRRRRGVLIGVSLFGGVAGYHFLETMSWINAFVNASMILSGMGPVTELKYVRRQNLRRLFCPL